MPGLDGEKMSKSYGNAILMREEPAEVTRRRSARCRPTRRGCGAPTRATRTAVPCGRCTRSTRTCRRSEWVVKGCTTAGIGCLECKQPLIDAIIREQEPIRERAQRYLDDPQLVRNIVADGCERARKLAEETMRDVRGAMGLDYT